MNVRLNEKTAKTEKVIHLLITTICDRNYKYCCNKQYTFDEIPYVTNDELKTAEVICLTGGEPFKYSQPNEIAGFLKRKYKNIKAIYVYTNAIELNNYLIYKCGELNNIDGLSVSIKCNADAEAFQNDIIHHPEIIKLKSNLLYIFDGLLHKGINIGNFIWKDRSWQPNFKPADDSIFRKI